MRIGIICPDIRRFDAVSNDALGMYAALKAAGADVYLFTISGLVPGPFPAHRYADAVWMLGSPEDLAIYHYCTADPFGLSVLRRLPCKIAIRYHNVTPAIFFADFSPALTSACRFGRRLLEDFMDLPVEFTISASKFNAQEFVAMGFPSDRCFVSPPFTKIEDLLTEGDEPATGNHLRQYSTNILTVGRIVPNKGIHRMIEALGFLKRRGGPPMTLQIVGGFDERLASYQAHLTSLIEAHGLQGQVHFHPSVNGNALASYYRQCDLFWTASQHEGFCVPVIEAMAFELPVLATRQTALPETCAEAALYADTVEEMAEGIERLAADDELRRTLVKAGRRRWKAKFSDVAIRRSFMQVLSAALALPPAVEPEGCDWFGMPDPERVSRLIRGCWPGRTLLTEGHRRAAVFDLMASPNVPSAANDYFGRADVLDFASNLQMPRKGQRLSAAVKLIWFTSSYAREIFPLNSDEEVADLWKWCMRNSGDALLPLMTSQERDWRAGID